jgi:hypothetical protein
LFAVLLGALLWWPLVPSASLLTQAGHAIAARADADAGDVGLSEQSPLGSSEHQAEDFAGEDPVVEPSCTSAPARLVGSGWTSIEFLAYECPFVPSGHDRFGRERGPPIA